MNSFAAVKIVTVLVLEAAVSVVCLLLVVVVMAAMEDVDQVQLQFRKQINKWFH